MQKLPRLIAPILLALLGLGLGGVAVYSIALSFRDTGTSMVAPGDTVVTITKPGDYTLWHECKTLRAGQFLEFPDNLPSGTTIKVIRNSDSTDIPLTKSGSSSFESSGYRRVSVGSVALTTPGDYRVSVTGLTEKRYLYLNESKFLRLFFKAMLLGISGILCLLGGLGWGIYVLVQKSPQAGEFRP
ncbi:MAG: hypothetical protein RL693_267 [Verrucomicrobiota bacterium]|jgi:hypothetical protein